MNNIASSAKLAFKRVTHVIFDLDGLLLDTEPCYFKAAQNVLDNYGKTVTKEIRFNLQGLAGSDVAKEMVKIFGLPLSWEEYYKLVKQQYPVLLKDADLMPDTESIYKRAFNDVAQRYGKTYTPAVMSKVIGTKEEEGAKIAVHEMKLPLSPQEFLKEYKSLAEKSLASVGIMPGAERLVRHFHTKQIPIAVATSSGEDSFNIKSTKHKSFFSLFNHIVCGGTDPEVKHGKPSPDIFLVCASRFKDKPNPDKCLVFEDAPNGVQAAVKAGMQVVWVPDAQIDEKMCNLATLKLNSLEEMRPELFGLPPLN